ncbi:hypothetical protein H8356DRAFT_1420673 [Neocallimastix lanati (nom. inval.)]|nr:hypothetical protein H8356DRAFT_1420673 [Neocallimastix sp. JGI-2020a]
MPGTGSPQKYKFGTLPRADGLHRDVEIWKFRMNDWFRREKFSYIISAAEDDIIPSLKEEQVRLNRIPTLDGCLRQLKRIIIEPNEIIFDFNTRYLELYDQLEIQNKVSLSVIDYENSLRPRFQIYERKPVLLKKPVIEQKNMKIYYRNLTEEVKEEYEDGTKQIKHEILIMENVNETNNNIIITKEENKNSFTGNTGIKKNQNNNMEINSIVTINIKTVDNNENINSNKRKIDNNISPINEHNKMIIKIPYIHIQNNDKNTINTNQFMMPKPEIELKEIIS